jgi:hypothetical protein
MHCYELEKIALVSKVLSSDIELCDKRFAIEIVSNHAGEQIGIIEHQLL